MKLKQTKDIINFLKPMEVNLKISKLLDIKEIIISNNPEFTALPKDFFEAILEEIPRNAVIGKGSWVEVGVWKGGGALFLRSLMNELNIDESLYLYDTFGKVPTTLINGKKDLEFVESFNLESETIPYLAEVQNLFETFNLSENVYYIESDINMVEVHDVPKSIAFLFIDVDFYEPVFKSLELFYDNLISGGILIIDDYYMEFLNCKEAVDSFFYKKKINLDTISTKFSSFAIKIIKP